MRIARALLIVVLAGSAGCTSGRLRDRTIRQGGTLPELQYRQVLDNLALFARRPGSLPWHVTLKEGTTQVTDSLSGGALIDVTDGSFLPQLFGSRTALQEPIDYG